MLTMTNPLSIEGFTVYHDDTNDAVDFRNRIAGGGNVQNARHFYVLPEVPTITRDAQGNPDFSLIVYRLDEDRISVDAADDDVGGGILTFTAELAVPEDKLKRIRSKLRTMIFGDTDDPDRDVTVSLVPFKEGTVSIAIAGETSDDTAGNEFLESIVGGGTVSAIGTNRVAVMAKLSQAGSALMSQLEDLRTLPINVKYRLVIEHRLVGVSMRVWCNMKSSYELMQETVHKREKEWSGYLSMNKKYHSTDKVTSVTETLVRNKTAGVSVIPATSEVDADTLVTLEKSGMDMLSKELGKALEASPPPKELDRNWLEKFEQDYMSNFNFSMDRHMVLERDFAPSGNITNIFTDTNFDQIVTLIDLKTEFFKMLKVPVRINADFSMLPIDSVTVTITYQREQFGGGGREVVTDTLDFTDSSKVETFIAFANTLEEIEYDWTAVVHYKGSHENFTITRKKENATFLVIDVGKMGMLDVDIGLSLTNYDLYPKAQVALRYHSTKLGRMLEQQFSLSEDQETALWTEVINEEPTDGFEYKVDWLRDNNTIDEGEWIKSTATKLRFRPPEEDFLKVQVICNGNFKSPPEQISKIGVRFRYDDAVNNYHKDGQVIFTDETQQMSWEIPLQNPDIRNYEYRYDIIYTDGLVEHVPEDEDEWLPGTPGFLTVGPNYTVQVDIYPNLLMPYPEHAKMVQVNMIYDDDTNNIHESDSFIFSAQNNVSVRWRISGEPGGTTTYQYEVQYFSAIGQMTKVGPISTELDALVVPPLQAPEPPPGG